MPNFREVMSKKDRKWKRLGLEEIKETEIKKT